MADALPWIRKDVDVVRMRRLSFYILIVAIVVLWPGEVAQEPEVGNGLEKEERTLAARAADELHRSILANFLRKEERDHAVVEAPMPPEVAVLHEFNRMHQMLFKLLKRFSPAVDLDAWNAQRQRDSIGALANDEVRRTVEAQLLPVQIYQERVIGLARLLRHIAMCHELRKIQQP